MNLDKIRYVIRSLLLPALPARHAVWGLSLMALGLTLAVFADTPPFEAARQQEQAGQPHEAFLKYLASPGAEYYDLALPGDYTVFVQEPGNKTPVNAPFLSNRVQFRIVAVEKAPNR